MNQFEACDYAAKLIKQIGFKLFCTSLKSEACYYNLSNSSFLFRISTHSSKKQRVGLNKVIVKVTFNERNGLSKLSEERVTEAVARAVGLYLLKSNRIISFKKEEI